MNNAIKTDVPQHDSYYLSLVVPVYNEEHRLQKTLPIFYNYLRTQPFSWELIFVLDGCHDASKNVIETFVDQEVDANYKNQVKVFNRVDNRGKGFSVKEGMLKAKGSIRLFADADNSTDIGHFDVMKPLFDQGANLVIASRHPRDAKGAMQAQPQPFHKRLMGHLGNRFIQLVIGQSIWDTQCGFKAMTAEAAMKLFPYVRLERWAFDVEVLMLAKRADYVVQKIPAYWIDDRQTNVKTIDYFKTLWDVIWIRWKLLRGDYRVGSSAVTANQLQDKSQRNPTGHDHL